MTLKAKGKRVIATLRALPAFVGGWVWRYGLQRPARLLTGLTLVTALLGTGVGYLAWVDQRQESVERARSTAIEAAQRGAVDLLSYDYRSIDSDLAKGQAHLTGEFRTQYTELMSKVVAPTAKEQQTVTRANVASTAVVSATSKSVQLLLFINQSTVGSGDAGPKLNGSRVLMTMSDVDGRWLVSAFKPV